MDIVSLRVLHQRRRNLAVRALSVTRIKGENGGYIAIFRNYPAASYAKRKGQRKLLNGRYARMTFDTPKRQNRSASRERRQEAENKDQKRRREEVQNELEAEKMKKLRDEVCKEIVEEKWSEIDRRIAERLKSETVKLQDEWEVNEEQLKQLKSE